jgi:exonuclease I
MTQNTLHWHDYETFGVDRMQATIRRTRVNALLTATVTVFLRRPANVLCCCYPRQRAWIRASQRL